MRTLPVVEGHHPSQLAKRHAALSCHGYGYFIIAPCSQRLQNPIEHQVSSQSSYPQIELRTQSCTSGSAVMITSEAMRPPRIQYFLEPVQERPSHRDALGARKPYIEGTATAAPLPDFCQRSSLRQSDRVAGSKFSDCWYADTLHVHLHFTGPIARRCAWLVLTPTLCETSTSSSGLSKLGDTFESCNDHPATVPVDSTSTYGARISEARQMFEGTLTTLLNPKRVISKCTITRRA
ncbi:hypothetical protein CABS01_03553 [Colletotrichum abscissum]|uniref:uncharacterized protein n=1 Tax=Colletotrichum abscissum TaxID=1671311 RepID=UPI0027D524D6|nr:uncharacterized protein CABS01_03553 [Colletotrichum abscissum]KAK1475276.1 hypothetical protein CABS01_03553 [Colletotrichum abscissum]